MSISDQWANVLWDDAWCISQTSDGYYTFENGYTELYMSTNGSSSLGNVIHLNGYIPSLCQWTLERYTTPMEGLNWISYATVLLPGESFTYKAAMYSSVIGKNGPVEYYILDTNGNAIASGNENVTILETTGLVTAEALGSLRVCASFPNTSMYWYVNLTVEESMEGMHFLKNKGTSKYMQQNNGNSYHAEQHDCNGSYIQRWSVVHEGNGYYSIQNNYNYLYLTAQDTTEEEKKILLESIVGHPSSRQLWYFTELSDGSYIVKAKSWEGTSLVLAVGDGINSNGINIEQKNYSSDEDYRDEWILYVQKDYTLMYIGYIVGDPLMPPILNAVDQSLRNYANMDGYAYTSLNKNDLIAHLSSSSIFSCITHGLQTGLTTTDGLLTISDINALDDNVFNNLEFAYLGACLTGKGTTDENNFMNALHNKGVNTVLGFTDETYVIETNLWTQVFMEALANGDSINVAMQTADFAVESNSDCDLLPARSTDASHRYLIGSDTFAPCN